jgi:methylthioribulose-1-phosphate dehydratase
MPEQVLRQAAGGVASADGFLRLAATLAEVGRSFYGRGWALGTSGNFIAVVSWEPLRLAITCTGVEKSSLTAEHFVEIDETGRPLRGAGRPSSEALLHLAIVRARRPGAVLHTHSVWNTLLSDMFAANGGFVLTGYEMLKGLAGVTTHEHREWLPILENSQDVPAVSRRVEEVLHKFPGLHGFLLRAHGLYSWGNDVAEACRHVEILEFLLETVGRTRSSAMGLGDSVWQVERLSVFC